MSGQAACEPCVGPALEALEPRLLLSGEAGVAAGGSAGAAALAPEAARLVEQNNAFAFDLYQALRGREGSLFFSPLSVSAALAMTYLGAAGRTAEQMADTFHWDAGGKDLAQAFHDLIAVLDRDEAAADPDSADEALTLDIANAMWGQEGFPFLEAFADLLESAYGAPLDRLDFVNDPEGAADEINDWVDEATRGLIRRAVSPDDFHDLTRFVLANAIYFNGSWEHAFNEDATRTDTFHLPDGDVDARLMRQTNRFRYGETDDYQVLELPYTGGASMVVLLPREGRFEAVEQSLSAEAMDAILDDMRYTDVAVTLPKIDCSTTYNLSRVLSDMGMTDAFTGGADFSRMSDVPLHIDKVKHLARIKVDESSTEAAAVTIVIGIETTAIGYPPPPVVFRADRPFIYTICDTGTGSTLFVGRVSDDSALLKPDEDGGDDGKSGSGEDRPTLLPPGVPGLQPGEPVPIQPPGKVLPWPGPIHPAVPEAPAVTAAADLLAGPELALLAADGQAAPSGGGMAAGEPAQASLKAPEPPTLADPVRPIDLDALPDAAGFFGALPADAEAPAAALPAPSADPLAGPPLDVLAGDALAVVFAG